MDAKDAVGHAEPGDYILAPRDHADRLPPEASALARVLQRSAIRVVVDRFERADRDAMAAQTAYKKRARASVYASGTAVLAGALLLYLSSGADTASWLATLDDAARRPLLAIQALGVGVTAYLTFFLREADPLSLWMNRRAEAEMARIALFEGVCGVTAEVAEEEGQDSAIPLLPLQLEYFRRYQLAVQLAYYDQRGRQHEAAANRMVTRGGLLTALFAVVSAGAGLLGEIGFEPAAALVLLAAPVVMSAHNSLKLLDQDRHNAIRYANTLEKLRAWSAGLDDVRAAVAHGDREALVAFVKGVDNEISLEHREWLTRRQEAEKPVLDLSRSRPDSG